jgi:hypothetical protein
MKASEIITKLQAIVAEHGDQNVGITTVGQFATASVRGVRFVDSDKVVPGLEKRVTTILISDYPA